MVAFITKETAPGVGENKKYSHLLSCFWDLFFYRSKEVVPVMLSNPETRVCICRDRRMQRKWLKCREQIDIFNTVIVYRITWIMIVF